MKYKNPVLRGMYPDPSVCAAEGKYYMVCSTFQYFPAVPVFESEDMVNWTQIGHCLTRKSQIDLEGTGICGGIFAPTIRYNNGRFYMVTTNATTGRNFYVYTDDIHGQWSEPVTVQQDGIDPSLFFESGKAYFISNGGDDEGKSCVRMCEIDIETGEKLSETKPLWYGTGGRFLEAPHLYKFGEYYYILDAEGGTEYGHMVNYARSRSMWGPFEMFPENPALTNRNLGGYILQGAGHGDIICDKDGNWWFMHLAFRQTGQWMTYHHLGRECCLVPLTFKDGWFYMGDGTSKLEYDLPDRNAAIQKLSYKKTFENLGHDTDWCFMRNYKPENYDFGVNTLTLTGTEDDLFSGKLPTCALVRQCEQEEEITVSLKNLGCKEAGVTLFMEERHHYDLFLDENNDAVLKINIGCVSHEANRIKTDGNVTLKVKAHPYGYEFFAVIDGAEHGMGYADTKYLSSEVVGGFTGVMTGLYAVSPDGKKAEFTNLEIIHNEE